MFVKISIYKDKSCHKLVSLALLILLLGCATATIENYEKILASWFGSSEEKLIAQWGPPYGVYEVSKDKKMLTFLNSRGIMRQYGYYSSHTQEIYCKAIFIIERGIVIGWLWKGNDCTAYPSTKQI